MTRGHSRRRLDRARYRGTPADSNYGLALMTLGELQATLPINEQTGWMEVDDLTSSAARRTLRSRARR